MKAFLLGETTKLLKQMLRVENTSITLLYWCEIFDFTLEFGSFFHDKKYRINR